MFPFPISRDGYSPKDLGIGLIIIGAVAVASMVIVHRFPSVNRSDIIKRQYMQAQQLWLSECKADDRKVDDCLRSWEELRTLQEMYVERVRT